MNSTLVLPTLVNSTGELLKDAAIGRGMAVEQIGGADVPKRLDRDHAVHVYGGPLFAGRVAAGLDVTLLEPSDDWLTRLPGEFLRREVRLMTLGDARWLRSPAFVKEPREKDLPAAVYADGSRLPDLGLDTMVLVSDIVTFVVEYRLFILDGGVHAGSRYATFGRLDSMPLDDSPHRDQVLAFANELLSTQGHTLPSAVVVDVGLATTADTDDEGWAVVEANMAWFSSAYAADIDRVLDVVMRSAGPAAVITESDRAFIRVRC